MLKETRGFTLVELMMGIVLGAILAITTSAILFSITLSWHRNSQDVGLQRDATFVLDMIARNIRPANNAQVNTPNSATLTIGNVSFYASGNSLWFDPDTTVSNNEVELISNRLSSVSFTENTTIHSVIISIVLQEGLESLSVNSTIAYRT